MRCMNRPFCATNDIKYRNVIPLITGEYVSLKPMPVLYVNPCATSLALYLTTLFFSFLLRTKTHFDPTWKIFRGVGITDENTSHFLSECNSALIASFHLIQSERLMHSAMVLDSGSDWRSLAILEVKLMPTIVVFLLNDSPESIKLVVFPLWLFYISQIVSLGLPIS